MRSLSVVALLMIGCGGGGVVGGMPDLGGGGGGGGGSTGTPPTLIAGSYVAFAGVTASGYAILTDSEKSAWAIKLADGTRAKIADHASWAVILAADTALVEHDVVNGFGGLSSWRTDGPAVTLTSASPDNSFGFSSPAADDAGHVAYFSQTAANGALSDIVIDRFDHSAPHTVATGIELSPSSGACWPNLRYFGGRLLGTHCATAGSSTLSLTSWDADSGAAVELLASSKQGFTTRTGLGVLMTSTTGALSIAAADGSGARAVASDIAAARLTRDGSAVIAVLASNQHVERLPLAAGATPTPLAGPVDRVVAVSPDGNYLTYSTMSDPTTFSTDLVLASAVSAGSVTSLVATNTSQSTSYAFSDDSAFALYVDAYDADAFTGTLHALPTAGGTTPRTLGNAVYDQATVGASRLVFEDNTSGTFPNQHADVEFVDLAQSAAPTRLATQALVQLWVDADNHTLYAVQSDGLHIIALP